MDTGEDGPELVVSASVEVRPCGSTVEITGLHRVEGVCFFPVCGVRWMGGVRWSSPGPKVFTTTPAASAGSTPVQIAELTATAPMWVGLVPPDPA